MILILILLMSSVREVLLIEESEMMVSLMDSPSSFKTSSCLTCLQMISALFIASLNVCMYDLSLKIFMFSFLAVYSVRVFAYLIRTCWSSCSPGVFIWASAWAAAYSVL